MKEITKLDPWEMFICWAVRKWMQWFPRWKEYFYLSDRAHQKHAEFEAAIKDYTSRASTRSRGFLTHSQAERICKLHMEATALWAAADRLMRAPDKRHIKTGEEPA